MKRSLLISLIGIFLLIIACKPQYNIPQINSFEDCVAAGNPVMESYPRQCRANGQTFVEVIEQPPQNYEGFTECTEEQKKADICTMDYNPVCGIVDNGIRCITEPCQSTDAKTFGNACGACAGQSYGYYSGACEDQTFVVCGETITGFDPVEYAKNNNGICVDICPHNYDPYMTQIGVQLCIEHYGVEEIKQWETCSRSTESCDCVKAYETTTGEEIEDAKYYCAPKTYGDRLLFRGGVDRLDENGQSSVAIA